MRFHVLKAAGLLGLLLPVVSAEATTITSTSTTSYFVTPTGINGNSLQGYYDYVGGNASTGANNPSFTIYQENGATLLSSLQAASGITGGTVSSITGLNLNLADESGNGLGGDPETAGSLVFSYASYATTPLSFAGVPYTTPAYDTTQVGGLSNQFGSTDSLGTATYTPGTSGTVTAYPLSGSAGLSDITNAIDSGSNFYIIVSAGTSTTSAALGGYYGYSSTIIPPANLTINATVAAVPEPTSLGLLATSGLMLLGRRRRTASV